ncbi:RNA 2',3'-cyclic phosphodiesterase [Paraglaciecola hydrolytica]|uniref:RNA 2',3'-cyclic phosphodiesterase n=1 Tax=Paraglaciecola hydrolytica TaxID=1799789 RepID=A0A136A221_9ALTE|nr:RNA 2',3'-cyclic phosphodiesterase [Paraglaciecola hydrolytica]KXI29298.1 2'-5' RNA ligase [Paraglaciecola hydrolytica]
MRAFLGLEPDAKTKLAIDAWRNKALPDLAEFVPPANYHITLAFLGQLSLRQQDNLQQLIDDMKEPCQFKVSLDTVGYWPKPKALWLGCQQTASKHLSLATQLTTLAQGAGISMLKRDYQAHLTLVRKCAANPPAPLIDPQFSWLAQDFHLYESLSTPKGVTYVIRNSWRLVPNISRAR